MLAVILAALAIAPWSGTDLPTATQAAAKYRLTVTGTPGSSIRLTTSNVAKGWIAAFCDMRVCSPFQVTEKIPASGTATAKSRRHKIRAQAPTTQRDVMTSPAPATDLIRRQSRS